MDLEALKDAVILGDVKGSILLTEVAIQAGHSPQKILEEALAPAMEIVGDKFRCNEVYVPEVLVAARAMKKSLALLKPLLTQTGVKPVATAVIGTVKGDLHDIGKNLVCMMLEGAGFEVVDAGADVAPEKFVQAVKETKAQILGISSLLTTTMLGMKDVLRALEQADLRKQVKVMVGGAPVTQSFADGSAPTPTARTPQWRRTRPRSCSASDKSEKRFGPRTSCHDRGGAGVREFLSMSHEPRATSRSKRHLIACEVFRDEFEAVCPPEMARTYLEQGLHRTPGKMPAAIQAVMDGLPADTEP